jgi:hypothetical protein
MLARYNTAIVVARRTLGQVVNKMLGQNIEEEEESKTL